MVPGVPWRRQLQVSVRFELRLERTKSYPFGHLPWARRWPASSGTSWWLLGAQKSRLGVGIQFIGVHFGIFVAHGKSRCFDLLIIFWRPRWSQRSPGGVQSGFLCVFISIWSERNSAQSGFCPGPGAGRHRLAPHGGLSGHKKPSLGRISLLWGPLWCFGGTWEKSFV